MTRGAPGGKLTWGFLNPFDIRKGEGRKTFLMFVYFFLTIATLYVLKPVRSSLFLEELGSENLRYVYLGEGFFLLFVTWAYVQIAKRVPKKRFFTGVLFFFISNLLIFWWLFHIQTPYLSALFYVWVACFSITVVTQFWTLANDIFNPLEAKRLFGLIISGGSAGGVLGGLVTNRAVQWLRTEDLLLLSASLLVGCMFLISLLWRHLPASADASRHGEVPSEPQSTAKLFLTSPYLWMLAGLVCLAKVGSTVVDNQFNAIVELHMVGKEAKTAFFGAFSAGLNVVSFLMQLYATSFSLRFFGIAISLTLLPVGLAVGSVAAFFYPLLATGTFLKIFDGSMNYSVQQASKEVLYLPLSSGARYRTKPVIDMLVYRASKSLGGLLIILLAPLFAIPNDRIGILVLVLVPFWLVLVWKMRDAYLVLLGRHLKKGKAEAAVSPPRRATEVLSFLYDEKSFQKLRSFLTQESTMARKMAAAACLVYHRAGRDLQAARRLVREMTRWEALEAAFEEGRRKESSAEARAFLDELLLRQAEKEAQRSPPASPSLSENEAEVLGRLEQLLQDSKQGMALKRRATRYLEHHPTQNAAGRVLEILASSEDHALRFLLIRTLLRMKEKNSGLEWNRALVKKEILREAGLYQNIQRIREFYLRSAPRKEEFLEVATDALAEESLERLFRCLGLLFPQESLRIIYERLLDYPEPDPTRSHAVELLQNLVGPEFSALVQELFERKAQEEMTEEEIVPLVEEMLVSPDRWLSLIGRFLVEELDLGRRWPRLGSLISTRSFESLDV